MSGELREPLPRPRLLWLAIRSESVPAGAPAVAHGVVASIEDGYFVAGPPLTALRTVVLWADVPPGAVQVGCVPTGPAAAVTVRAVHAGESPDADAAAAAAVVLRRGEGSGATLTCPDGDLDGDLDGGPGGAGLVVEVRWTDGATRIGVPA